MPDNAVEVRGLTKTYGSGFKALKNVNLDIGRGEIFALAPGQEGVPICRIEPDCLRRRSAGACGGSVAGQRITCWRRIGSGRVRQRCGHRVPSPPLRPGRTLCRVPLVAPPGFASDSAVFPDYGNTGKAR